MKTKAELAGTDRPEGNGWRVDLRTRETRELTLSGRIITQVWDGLCWTTVKDEAR